MVDWYYRVVFTVSFITIAVHCRSVTNDKREDDFIYTCTGAGVVRGRKHFIEDDKILNLFLGIPYAAPPVGERRFAKPAPVRPWKGVRDALLHGAKCVQRLQTGDPVLSNVPFSEDCLYLDVYSPRLKSEENLWDSKMAVMMFVHGGSFFAGTGAKYNFTNLALKGVVVVTINYRLGVFGFLSTEDDVIPGNFGLLDMVMALDWVKENIKSFGGDPDRITLFGGSAGAISVSLLSLSPLSRGKFQGVITQSGVSTSAWGVRNQKTKLITSLGIAKALGQGLGCPTFDGSKKFSTALLSCLRQRPVGVILSVESTLKEMTKTGEIPLWLPVVETTFGFLPDTPLNLIRDPAMVPIPSIRGYTLNDGSFIVNDPEDDGLTLEEFQDLLHLGAALFYPDISDEVVNRSAEAYLPNTIAETASKFEIREIAIRFLTDITFMTPTIQEAILFSESHKKSESYVYELDLRPSYLESPLWMGVRHSSEKGFVLDLPQGPDPYKYPRYTETDLKTADLVSTLWANFAKYGNPTVEKVNGLIWTPFVSETNNVVSQCDSSTPSSPFKPNFQYNLLKINATSEMVLFDKCDQVNFWAQFSNPV